MVLYGPLTEFFSLASALLLEMPVVVVVVVVSMTSISCVTTEEVLGDVVTVMTAVVDGVTRLSPLDVVGPGTALWPSLMETAGVLTSSLMPAAMVAVVSSVVSVAVVDAASLKAAVGLRVVVMADVVKEGYFAVV